MTDNETRVAELREIVRQFVDERDWNRFHNPKNLSMAIAIEAAELMEHFQWRTLEESATLDSNSLANVRDELADVMCYCLALANSLGIDISSAIQDKMARNRQKYPVEEFRGRFGRDDPRPPSAPE